MQRTLQRLKIFAIRLYMRINLSKMKKHSKRDEGSIWDFLAGLVIGYIGYGILSELVKPRVECPVCHTELEQGLQFCPRCHSQFKWNKE